MNKNLKKVLITGVGLLMLASAGAGISTVNANATRIYEHVAAKSVHGHRGLWLRYGSKVHIKSVLAGAYKVTIPGHRGEWIIPDLHGGAKQSKAYIRSLKFSHHKRHARKHARHHAKRHSRRNHRRNRR